jgi:hypothetical protein
MPYAAQDVRGIALNAHTPTAPIPLLPPPKFAVQKLLVDRHSRRHSTYQGNEGFTVAFAGC